MQIDSGPLSTVSFFDANASDSAAPQRLYFTNIVDDFGLPDGSMHTVTITNIARDGVFGSMNCAPSLRGN